jgi:cobaltochelatase CobS
MYNHSTQITNSTTLSELQRVLGDNLNADNVSAEQELRLKQLAIAYNKPMSTPISDLVTLWNDGDVQTTKVVVDTSDAEKRLNNQFETFKNDVDTSFTSAVSNITSDMSADIREYQRKHDRQTEEFMGEASRQISKLKQLAQSMRTIEVKTEAGKVDFTGEITHEIFEDVLTTMSCDNVYLVGGAGAGKTTLGYQVAKAFKLPFYSASAVKWEHQLMGQLTATGEYKPTDFYRAFKDGGVFLFDEMDASHPNALVSFNQALDIQVGMEAPFPCGMVRKHKNFKAIASANTVGHGASRQYIGRNKLDGATLDRFAEIDMRYDEKIERAIAQNDKWVTEVRTVRAIAEEKKMAYIISPRASIKGAMLLRAGMNIDKVRNMRLYKGMTDADANILRKECKARMKATQESK